MVAFVVSAFVELAHWFPFVVDIVVGIVAFVVVLAVVEGIEDIEDTKFQILPESIEFDLHLALEPSNSLHHLLVEAQPSVVAAFVEVKAVAVELLVEVVWEFLALLG